MSSKSTPDYFHCIQDKRFRANVYEPEADTFLFLDGIDKDAAAVVELVKRGASASDPVTTIVEIGCGSGTVITHLASTLTTALAAIDDVLPELVRYHAVDINPIALEATRLTWEKSTRCHPKPITLATHLGDLFEPLPSDLDAATPLPESFDVILFNPPYVPTSAEELAKAVEAPQRDLITAAWCGGPRGRVVVDRFISQLPQRLKAGGSCYIIAIKENDVEDMFECIRKCFFGVGDIELSVVIQRFTGEDLCLIRAKRS